VRGLTFGTLTAQQKADNRASYNVWDIALSLLVLGMVAFVMASFTG
jgi:SSS family solute:Na+ symporter